MASRLFDAGDFAWDTLPATHVPICLDQRTYGPIWGRIHLARRFGQFLYDGHTGPREFVFFLSNDGATVYDRYHTQVSTLADIGPGDMAIRSDDIIAACREAWLNTGTPFDRSGPRTTLTDRAKK